MAAHATIDGGFAEGGAGLWLMGRSQPAAFSGTAVRRRRRGWRVCDRSRLDLVETTGVSRCASSASPFLTHIPCAAPVFAVSDKVLVAPSSARSGAEFVKAIPMSARGALCVTVFGERGTGKREEGIGNRERETGKGEWVVMATASRTCRMPIGDGETVSVRPEAVVAWTGGRPTGFCPKLSVWDILLPRGPRDLLFTFYGPGVVWVEGSGAPRFSAAGRAGARPSPFERRAYGV